MLRFIIILFFSSTLFSQEKSESWLDYVIEENKEEISETSSMNVDNEFYYTIQIAVKKTFDEAMEVVQALNASDIDAFIQKMMLIQNINIELDMEIFPPEMMLLN
jgi:mevalonate pyrophosphate decarboxylase